VLKYPCADKCVSLRSGRGRTPIAHDARHAGEGGKLIRCCLRAMRQRGNSRWCRGSSKGCCCWQQRAAAAHAVNTTASVMRRASEKVPVSFVSSVDLPTEGKPGSQQGSCGVSRTRSQQQTTGRCNSSSISRRGEEEEAFGGMLRHLVLTYKTDACIANLVDVKACTHDTTPSKNGGQRGEQWHSCRWAGL
jgi:hypothetical protein